MKKQKKRKNPLSWEEGSPKVVVSSVDRYNFLVRVPNDHRINVENVLDDKMKLVVAEWGQNISPPPDVGSNVLRLGMARVILAQKSTIAPFRAKEILVKRFLSRLRGCWFDEVFHGTFPRQAFTWLFGFKSWNEMRDRFRVFNGGPYLAFGKTLMLRLVDAGVILADDLFTSVPTWVLFHDVPLSVWSESGLSKIASKVGIPMYTDKVTKERTKMSYARCLVDVDVSKPPVLEFGVKLSGGRRYVQKVTYECYPDYCCDSQKAFGLMCLSAPSPDHMVTRSKTRMARGVARPKEPLKNECSGFSEADVLPNVQAGALFRLRAWMIIMIRRVCGDMCDCGAILMGVVETYPPRCLHADNDCGTSRGLCGLSARLPS
ncbi:hypothetical protein Leryth_026732, partial [Lithospermum erythrorhizon]